MNSLTIVLMLIVGAVLIYSAVKGVNPIEILKTAVTQKTGNTSPAGRAGSAVRK